MKKYLLPIVLTVPLVLTACGKEDEPAATPSPLAVETTSEAPSGPVEVELGETINLTQDANGARDIDLTIDDITVSGQCHTGLNGHTDEPEEDGYYVRMTGEMNVKQSQTNFSFSELSLTALDGDGYTIEVTPAFACNYPYEDMDGYQWFENPIDQGQRARGALEFWVADVPEKIAYSEPYEQDSWFWVVPENSKLETTTAAESPVAEPVIGVTEAPSAAQPKEMNKSIQFCGDALIHETGTTFFSDGSTGWTEQCSDEMLQNQPPVEEVPVRDESLNIAPEGRYYTQEDLDNGFIPAP